MDDWSGESNLRHHIAIDSDPGTSFTESISNKTVSVNGAPTYVAVASDLELDQFPNDANEWAA